MLFVKFGWNLPGCSEEKDFEMSMYFRYFANVSPLENARSFIWTNLNPLHLKMFCAIFQIISYSTLLMYFGYNLLHYYITLIKLKEKFLKIFIL